MSGVNSRDRLEAFAEAAIAASGAEETALTAIAQEENLTRFANNHIHQNVNERSWYFAVRAALGGRVGIAVSGDPSIESARALAARAVENARLQPENPDFAGFANPAPGNPRGSATQGFDDATALAPPAMRAERVGIVCREAAAAGYTAAGSMTTGWSEVVSMNSRGVFAAQRTTLADGSTVVLGDSSSGWAQSSGWSLDAVDWRELAADAIRKTRLGENPATIEPGTYRVILDPYATADLVGMLAEGMSALTVQEERSWLNDRVGRKIMADSVTLIDDGADPAGIPLPFDSEGVPKQRVTIVESGVVRGPVFDTATAARAGAQSTGHASLPSATERPGPAPSNLFMRPGTSSVEEMIRSTELGLYITRFWYTRYVHPRDVVVTGMTRDGTFVVRNGAIAEAVKSLRFTQSYLDALASTEAIGKTLKVLRWGTGAIVAPAVQLGAFRFTSATK